jgi:hypothetical protein
VTRPTRQISASSAIIRIAESTALNTITRTTIAPSVRVEAISAPAAANDLGVPSRFAEHSPRVAQASIEGRPRRVEAAATEAT